MCVCVCVIEQKIAHLDDSEISYYSSKTLRNIGVNSLFRIKVLIPID